MKIFTVSFISFITFYLFFSYKKEAEVGQLLANSLGKEIYTDFETAAYDSVFFEEYASLSKKYENIKNFHHHYKANGAYPGFVIKFFGDKGLDSLVRYLDTSSEHGFNAKIFPNQEIRSLIEKLKRSDFKALNESYPLIARLEILSAEAFLRYANYLRFGLVNPRKLFLHYYIDVKQADSAFNYALLNSVNMIDTLRSLQSQSPQYKLLQQSYLKSKNDSAKKILAVNMERLRWDLPKIGDKYIQVNIPDFKLVYFNGNDTLTSMKVCVGKKRDADYDQKLKVYEQTSNLEDRPQNRETPLLMSSIKSFYSNPVWNIPESIAQTEVYSAVRKNPSYLKKHNIAVFYKNKLVENPSRIRWYKCDRKKLPFLFVQQPGSNNSLGKLKFLFPNSNSVYLHDTNFKKAFKFNNRAISHGCIRLEKPLQLAQLLIADEVKSDKIRMELGLKPLFDRELIKAHSNKKKVLEEKILPMQFFPKEEIPLIITYFTAWSQNNKIQYRSDVYEMDEKLWMAMKKFR